MSSMHDPPSKVLRFFAGLFGEFLLTFALAGLLGLWPGLVAGMAIGYGIKPGATRARAYAAIAVGLLASLGSGYSRFTTLNALRVWEGVESPALVMTTLDGRDLTLEQLRGKRIALNFWATWCGSCQAEIPELNRLVKETGNPDVEVIGVSNESPETLRAFLAANPVDYTIATLAGAAPPAPFSDIAAVPTTIVIDRKGVIQTVRTGYAPAKELKQLIWDADDYSGPSKPLPPLTVDD